MEDQILNELIKADSRCSAFHITPQKVSKRLEKLKLNEKVPEEVLNQIIICKKLCLYSYFVYEFATVGQQLSFLAIETALKERLRLYYLDGFDFKNTKTSVIRKEKPHSLTHFQSLLKNDELQFEGIKGFFKRRINMYDLINWAIKKGILKEKFMGEGDTVRNLRNFAAHPSRQMILPPWNAIQTLEINIKLINSLFI